MRKTAIWDITSRCNLKCKHCYNNERYGDTSKSIPELTSDEISSVISKLKEMKFTQIHMLGGEPLLSDGIEQIARVGSSYGMLISLVTNGVFLTPERFRELVSYGVRNFSISLDGSCTTTHDFVRGKGVFDKVVKNIQACIYEKKLLNNSENIGPRVGLGISYTLMKHDLETVPNIMELSQILEVDSVNISYLSNEGAARDAYFQLNVSEKEKFEYLNRVLTSYKHNEAVQLNIDARSCLGDYIYRKHAIAIETTELGCAGGVSQFYVLADGVILPCSPMGTSISKSFRDEFFNRLTPPNMLQNSLSEVNESDFFERFAKEIRLFQETRLPITCESCRHDCVPCPILYDKELATIDECDYAQKMIISLDKELLDRVFIKNELINSIEWDQEQYTLRLNEYKYQLSNIGYNILCLFDGKNKVDEILGILFKTFRFEDYKRIKKDLIDFTYDLIYEGLIEDYKTQNDINVTR